MENITSQGAHVPQAADVTATPSTQKSIPSPVVVKQAIDRARALRAQSASTTAEPSKEVEAADFSDRESF